MKKILAALLVAPLALPFASALAAAPDYKVTHSIAVGGEARWDYLTVDSGAHRLYVSHGTQTEVIDTQSEKVIGTIAGTEGVHGIAIASDLGVGYTSNGKSNSVTVFDLATLKTRSTINVGTNPDAIVYVAASSRLITFNGRSKDATVIDAKTGAVTGTVAVGGKPEFAQVGSDGKVYFNGEDTSELEVLDPVALKIVRRSSLKPCDSPSGLAIDSQQRLYSVCDNKMMIVTGSDGKRAAQVAVGSGPDGVAWLDGLAFSANGVDGNVTIVGESTPGKFQPLATIPSAAGARTIAADAATHKLYLPTADLKPGTTGERRQGIPGTFRILVLERQ
jgi:YVTN family beta-propeller protein